MTNPVELLRLAVISGTDEAASDFAAVGAASVLLLRAWLSKEVPIDLRWGRDRDLIDYRLRPE